MQFNDNVILYEHMWTLPRCSGHSCHSWATGCLPAAGPQQRRGMGVAPGVLVHCEKGSDVVVVCDDGRTL